MVDTIKLIKTLDHRPSKEDLNLPYMRTNSKGVNIGLLNPNKSIKHTGRYFPNITYIERPNRLGGLNYEISAEISLPKLVFGNNFDELSDDDFSNVIDRLRKSFSVMGIEKLFGGDIENLEVTKIDFSKNVIFNDYTPVSSIIKNIASADISKIYDVQNTDFRNGGYSWHMHTNSADITIYDKIADLKQSRISDKRSVEKYNAIQIGLLDRLETYGELSVVRFEVRLNGKKQIRKALKDMNLKNSGLKLKGLFNSNVSRKILMHHWQNIIDLIPKIPLDDSSPDKLFVDILKNSSIKPQKALAKLGYQLLQNTHDNRYIRAIIENRFNSETWRRVTTGLRDLPDRTQLKSLLKISDDINAMKPIRYDGVHLYV